MREHEARSAILAELHARPFLPVEAPRRLYHFAFATNDAEVREDRRALLALCEASGAESPQEDAKFCHLALGDWELRWEQHTEFTTYTWSTSQDAADPFAHPDPLGEGEIAFLAPGRLVVAAHLAIIAGGPSPESLAPLFVRPSVMFGPDDAFLTTILRLLRQLPIYPMFGRGLTKLQPAYVEDVAEAVGRTMQRAESPPSIFEFGGPRVYSYEEFLRAVARQAGLAPRLVPIPFAVWNALAWASEMFPNPLLTRNQVELMQIDTVSSPKMPGLVELGISPHSVEAILQQMLSNCR
jgi:Protein of unknown function (DUF3422)